ncbi:MAG: hypothetical protein IMX00_04225 [Limnochordales bacterium]|nr:hypothetical protein [Limnochordales bacterium]
MDVEKLTDEQILERLLNGQKVPQARLWLKRLQIPVVVQALTSKQVYAIREQCTRTIRGKRGQPDREEVDTELFTLRVVLAGIVEPKFDNPRLLEKLQVSGPEEALQRLLLAGELSQIFSEILALSGFDEDLTELKN